MADTVFIEGRAAVHKGSNGKSIAFPDVCLCPPGPPAGPVPVPLPNTVVAKDLEGGATSVLIEGNPAGKKSSYFKTSTGNEVSRSTGGGVSNGAVQGKAHFQTFSSTVFIEGEPAVRHLDLVTHNHVAQPPNTPPAPWVSVMEAKAAAPPKSITRTAGDGPEWVEIALEDDGQGTARGADYQLKVSDGRVLTGHLPAGGVVRIVGLPKGNHQVELVAGRTRRAP